MAAIGHQKAKSNRAETEKGIKDMAIYSTYTY
jgi:hypothetical protein